MRRLLTPRRPPFAATSHRLGARPRLPDVARNTVPACLARPQVLASLSLFAAPTQEDPRTSSVRLPVPEVTRPVLTPPVSRRTLGPADDTDTTTLLVPDAK